MPNRLADETSPYLQQHADNPVDWYPWGEEALALARSEDKPILLSIGYSACHWCHVMAHESFEDAEVAAIMNALYVNIKVDREERPDLDQIYQSAHWLLTQRNGGWPLTMFLTPHQVPFYGGTYFPKTPRYHLPGFGELLQRVATAYRAQGAGIAKQNAGLLQALSDSAARSAASAPLGQATLDAGAQRLREIFDPVNGGFGSAPKFPHPTELEFCLRRFAAGDAEALNIADHTLRKMADGGIYDHLGGGFCRYSTDAQWTIPHFEKMLYDNAALLGLYTDAWRISGAPRYAQVVEETAAWLIGTMQSPEGGYYSSIDADSQHEEGKFYVWSREEVAAALTADEYAVMSRHFGLAQAANFEGQAWHLHIARELIAVAAELRMSEQQAQQHLARARAKLFALRRQRVAPGRDEKILTSWNALCVKAMARAAAALQRDDWLDSALRAKQFLREKMWQDGRLRATYKDGRAHLNAYLDDYAFLLDALLELLQLRFDADDLAWCGELAQVMLSQFEDPQRGFFFTSHDHEQLIHRPKPAHDNATPAGNGVAAHALQRYAHLTGEAHYLQAAERTLDWFAASIDAQPSAHCSLLHALEEHLKPPKLVLLRGPAAQVTHWQRQLQRLYLPHTMVLALSNATQNLTTTLDKPEPAQVNAWICEGVTCMPPIAELAEVVRVCKAV